jgi:hydroxyethylthiazole kinase-like uncharacterized protein yjeF
LCSNRWLSSREPFNQRSGDLSMILGERLTVREMGAVERNCSYLGVPTGLLMENAGRSVAEEVKRRFKPGSRVTVVSGLSGNGGDGCVAARHLAAAGYQVNVIVLGDPAHISHENTRSNYEVLTRMSSSVNITVIRDSSLVPEIKADVVIDGLIGTSMRGSLKPPFMQMVDAVNRADAYKGPSTATASTPTSLSRSTGPRRGTLVIRGTWASW